MSIAADRYARALLEVSGAQDADAASKALDALAHALRDSKDLNVVMADPRLAPERMSVLNALAEKVQAPTALLQFLKVLDESDRLRDLPAIAAAFRKLADAKAGRVRGEVTSAVALSDGDKQALHAALEREAGKKVSIEYKVDPALIGGVVSRVEDLVWDGSVRTQLARLKQTLTSGL